MGYQPKVGDVFVGRYQGKETRLIYGGMTDAEFPTQMYFLAEGEQFGDKIGPRDSRDVVPLKLVASLGMEKWQQAAGMPSSLQRQARLEELLDGHKPQATGFSLARLLGRG